MQGWGAGLQRGRGEGPMRRAGLVSGDAPRSLGHPAPHSWKAASRRPRGPCGVPLSD